MAEPPTTEPSLGAWLADCRAWSEDALREHLPSQERDPRRLHAAMQHAVLAGGKRLRPALVRTVARALGGDDAAARRPAVAVELVHTYSLVHDDLPCMDDDRLRRGLPTVHVRFDEATAVLAGDALLTLAFEVLAGTGLRAGALAGVLARAAGSRGMVGGQQLDLALERSGEPGLLAEVDRLHGWKTAALFGAACEMGALAADGADHAPRVRAFGLALGRLFQAVDDVLDVTGDASTLGKTPGKDQAHERPTLVALLGLEGARRHAEGLAAEARELAAALGWARGQTPFDLVDFVLTRQA